MSDHDISGYTGEGINPEFADLSNLQLLVLQKRQVLERLAEIQRNAKPSYDIDGQKFSWTEYQRFLVEQIKSLNQLIAEEDSPFEEETLEYM